MHFGLRPEVKDSETSLLIIPFHSLFLKFYIIIRRSEIKSRADLILSHGRTEKLTDLILFLDYEDIEDVKKLKCVAYGERSGGIRRIRMNVIAVEENWECIFMY